MADRNSMLLRVLPSLSNSSSMHSTRDGPRRQPVPALGRDRQGQGWKAQEKRIERRRDCVRNGGQDPKMNILAETPLLHCN